MPNGVGAGSNADTLAISTIEPHDAVVVGRLVRASRAGPRATARKAGVALIASVASQPASGMSCSGPSPMRRPLPPATANRASMRPSASRAAAKAATACVSSDRSATACGSAERGALVGDLPMTNTSAPSATKRRTAAAAIRWRR